MPLFFCMHNRCRGWPSFRTLTVPYSAFVTSFDSTTSSRHRHVGKVGQHLGLAPQLQHHGDELGGSTGKSNSSRLGVLRL